jgi:hypothetical protein
VSLLATLNYALQIVAEPGYYTAVSSEQWESKLNQADAASLKAFWSDEATRTLMLFPRQLRSGFLNTASQLDSIIGFVDRGSGKLVVNSLNITAGRLYEAALKGNASNPWMHHQPLPGTGSSFLELLAAVAMAALEAKLPYPATTADFRVMAYTEEKLIGNQALYLRWFQPDARVGGQFIQGFSIGQYTLVFSGDTMDVMQDISPHMDRTAFRRVLSSPLFSGGSIGQRGNSNSASRAVVDEAGPGDRAILWLPFHRNLIYIQASSGKFALLNAHTFPQLNGKTGDAEDWDIVDDRELLVFGISPSVGRFQIQKVKFVEGLLKIRIPSFKLDYAPAVPLDATNIVTDFDAYRGSSLTHEPPATPPGYDNVENELDTCPAVTTDPSATTREYGLTYTFLSSTGGRFTPFLYGLEVRVPRAVGTWPVVGVTFGDDKTTPTRIVSAEFSSSIDKPSESQLEMQVLDGPPISIGGLWFRSEYPIRLRETSPATDLFIGISRPTQVEPPKYAVTTPRQLEMRAETLWRWLADAPLRDQRDWTGEGHIDVVLKVAQQAGIDTTGADLPSPLADWNTPLGGVNTRVPQMGILKPHWRPNDTDTAASFITRIAEQFSGYVVGFYPNGQFYYLPRDPWFYNASEGEFKKSRQADPTDPIYEDPVVFEIVEPEANVVQVVANSPTGGRLRSSLWVDWASIRNPLAVNFLGRWRLEILPVDGVLTCSEINRIAYTAFKQTRRRHLLVKFHGDYVPSLRVGRVFTLEGQAGTWRLMKFSAQYEFDGIPKADYEAELVELGYNLG